MAFQNSNSGRGSYKSHLIVMICAMRPASDEKKLRRMKVSELQELYLAEKAAQK